MITIICSLCNKKIRRKDDNPAKPPLNLICPFCGAKLGIKIAKNGRLLVYKKE